MTENDELRIRAMYQLEMATDLIQSAGQRLEMDGFDGYVFANVAFAEAIARSCAALYMVQAMGGIRPDNYDEVMSRAASYDAWAETHDLIARTQRGHRLDGH